MNVIADILTGIAHQRAGRVVEAETLYRAVLATEPCNARALYLLGLLRLNGGHAAEAAATLRRAAAVRPEHTETQLYLARALIAAGQPDQALGVADRLLAADPRNAEADFLRGTALNALDQPEHAIAAFQHCLERDPGNAAAMLNLGNALADLDRLEEAEEHCRAALSRAPDLAEAHASLGYVLTARGQPEAAIAACDKAITLRPDFAAAHWNLAVAALLGGDFNRGLGEYEWRKRHDRFRRDFIDLPGPQWDGSDPSGRTILVHAEQGLGDTIQFARYLPLIAERGGHPILACERPLLPLLAQLPGCAAVAKDAALPPYDLWIDQMSLPLVFGTRLDTIPARAGYLRAEHRRVARWRESLPAALRVGLCWAGNPAHCNDRRRSMPATSVWRILAADRVGFVNLQVGPRAGETGLTDLSPRLADFAETAALIDALDLVVSVDTSVAHLAGALGKPAWVLLAHSPDWRWLLERDDTPWYSSIHLIRQPTPGDWDAVANEVAAALAGLHPA